MAIILQAGKRVPQLDAPAAVDGEWKAAFSFAVALTIDYLTCLHFYIKI